MGYDHECIVNIQSLPGEYFCPVCRTLVYPSEALQSQCTHLYCKPCLAYIVATTHACPYDGYLVTEADSKPLTESGKELAETIGKVSVYCLYQRSGCQWQGTLAESNAHCAGCTYGNSPVVCNRCGTQIIHRQVQEHAQICPGIQPQAQTVENAQAQASVAANTAAAAQDLSSATPAASTTAAPTAAVATSAPQTNAALTAPMATVTSGIAALPAAAGPAQVQGAAVAYPQAVAQAPTPEQQWYQQQQLQYQQYYQQYPGYDPYQQQYYAQYQQHAYPQYAQSQMQAAPQLAIPGHQQPQPYMQPQVQPQPQSQPHLQPQPQMQPQPQLQVMPQGQPQPQLVQAQPQAQPQLQPQLQPQPQVQAAQPHIHPSQPQMQAQQPQVPQQQPHLHAQMQTHPPPHGPVVGQPYPQPQPNATQARPPHPPGPPQHPQAIPPQQLQQQMPQQQIPQQQIPQPYPQSQPQLHALQQPRPQQPFPNPQPQLQQAPMQMQQPQAQPNMQPPNPPHAVSGYQSYPQLNPGAPQQRPMHMHPQQQGMPGQLAQQPPQAPAQYPPQQPPQMRPPHSQMAMPVQQPAMLPPQGSHTNVYPSQQQVQHPAHQPAQQVQQQPGMPHHGAQHGYPQPHPQGLLHPGQPQQHGSVPPQHQVHPQQSVRPQGQAYTQQPLPGPPQGLPPNQAQARPMMQQPVPHSPGAGPKVMQPAMNQQSPNQSYMGRGPQSGPVQQSQLPRSGSQGGLVPVSPKQGASTPDKVGHATLSEGTRLGERNSEHVQDLKSTSVEGKGATDVKEKDAQIENENKDGSESVAKEENVDGSLVKKLKEEENASRSVEAPGSLGAPKAAGEEKETQAQERKLDNRSGPTVNEDGSHRLVDRGQIGGNANNMHPPPQMPGSGAFGRGQQQPMQENMLPAQQRGYPQTGYNDRNPTEFPQHYSGSDNRREMPPGGPFSGQQRYPPANPQGHPPQWPDPTMAQQRPPAPDRMFPQSTPHSSQERRFPEPSSDQMPMHGQAMPPNQMRPPGHASETFSHHGQEPFWPPPQAGLSGPSLPPPPPPPPGGVQVHHGFPPKGAEQHAMAPQGQLPSHMPPHAGGARNPLSEPYPRPMMDGPPHGAFDAPSRMTGAPPFIHEDKVGQSVLGNAMEADPHAVRRPGVYDGRQLDPHRPSPMENAPYGQQSVMKMNGNNVPAGGMHDPSFAHGFAEDRFRSKPFPEEGFKGAPDEHFRPSLADPARHIANRREFEEDLKQFPRPSYLDGEGPPRADGFLPSSRPLDRMTQPHGGFNALTSRPMPSYQSGAPFPPPSIGSSEFNSNIMDRERPIPFPEHLGRKHEDISTHPDRPNQVPEFTRHRLDGLPPLRSPGHFGRDFPDGPPSQLRRGPDGHGPRGLGLPSDIRGNETGGPPNLANFSRGGGGFGGFHGRPDMGEPGGPGNLPAHLRLGDPGFNGHFSSVSREGDNDPFEQSRKRKPGGMVRCLICKIDCETVEGLEMHSQTRGHQKMAMDMVLSIKKDNAKKHKFTTENLAPTEGANRPRKASFEKRGNRQ